MDNRVRRREYTVQLPEHGTTIHVRAAHTASQGQYKEKSGAICRRAWLRIRLIFSGGKYEAAATAFAEICAGRADMVLTISNGCAEVQFTAHASWYV